MKVKIETKKTLRCPVCNKKCEDTKNPQCKCGCRFYIFNRGTEIVYVDPRTGVGFFSLIK